VNTQNKELILRTIETLLQLQIKSVRQMLGEEDVEKVSPRRSGVRRQSLVASTVKILMEEKRALHVNEIVDLLRERLGRIADRDTISSALAKKVRQGVLVQQTGPATFALLDTSGKSSQK